MSKLTLFVATTVVLLSTTAYATLPAQPIVKPAPVLSPADFNKKVTKMSKQSDEKINQQLNSRLSEQPSLSAPTVSKRQSPTSTPSDSSYSSYANSPTVAPKAPSAYQGNPSTNRATVPTQSTGEAPNGAAEPAAPDQNYTGFGNNSAAPATSSGTTSPSSSSSGGWNIKY